MNNLSISSLLTMSAHFQECFNQVYLPWMAQYLVKRASIELNLHNLYLIFINYLGELSLNVLVLRETHSSINAILLSEAPLNTTVRSSLNNLGHWLGLQTLAKDQCISTIELPVREFLVSAAHRGYSVLLPLISFVAQLLKTNVQRTPHSICGL